MGLVAEALFLGTDFDGTTHLTSEPAPDGSTVDSAYAEGIDAHLGSAAVDIFINDQKGHCHRDPTEIVASLAQDADSMTLNRLTRLVTETKLSILEASIGKPLADGTPWPRLTPGFGSLWRGISLAKERGLLIGTAIISAGHTDFQRRAFEVHGLAYPDVFMTADVIRAMHPDIPHEQLAKPASFMLEAARQTWSYGQRQAGQLVGPLRTIVTGDSLKKDGGLAQVDGSEFALIDPETSLEAWRAVGQFLQLPEETLENIRNEQ